MRVLQVDPDPAWCAATAAWLEQFFGSAEIERVATADEALRYIRNHCPDLVLATYPLATAGGSSLAAAIKARPNPPVVVVLATAIAGLELQCRGAGVDLLLDKRHLQSRLLAFLQRRFPKVWAEGVAARSRASLHRAKPREYVR